jgi:purine-binding chemotaxis protein CheW
MHDPALHRYCTFRIGTAVFAVAAADVVEVLRAAAATRVPLAPQGVAGLVHLRGRIVPVVDPAVRLEMASPAAGRTHLVIALDDDWYGLVIDEMLDVVEIPAERIERPTAAADGGCDFLDGVFAAPDRLVHLLDPRRMIHSLARHRPPSLDRHSTPHDRP